MAMLGTQQINDTTSAPTLTKRPRGRPKGSQGKETRRGVLAPITPKWTAVRSGDEMRMEEEEFDLRKVIESFPLDLGMLRGELREDVVESGKVEKGEESGKKEEGVGKQDAEEEFDMAQWLDLPALEEACLEVCNFIM
ncbi:hypothetical protein BC829DRAFT_404818, partial [Chytridium lagenaria]